MSYANSDLARFSDFYGLPQFGSVPGGDAPVFIKLDATGGVNYPISGTGNGEFAGDVSTIHALAPMANIVVITAPSDFSDAQLAALYPMMMSLPGNWPGLPEHTQKQLEGLPPVSVVSSSVYNSYVEYPSEIGLEHDFVPPFPETQPATVVIAAGDTGYFGPLLTGPQYPGNSAHVISAAMTQPTIGTDGTFYGEVGVADAGGGPSLYLPQPVWQAGVVDGYGTTTRVNADVGFAGSYNSGTSFLRNGQWEQANGSSNAAPAWAALIAILNEGRSYLGQKPLNGPTETLPKLYSLPAGDWHKITQLDDGMYVPGNYNIAAGLGSPVANLLAADMLGGQNVIAGTVRNAATGAGLAGRTVFLDANNDGVFQAGVEGSTTTAADGSYRLVVAPGANYRPRVVVPAGFVLVSADPAPITFPIGSGASSDNDFRLVAPPLATTIALTLSAPVALPGQPVTFTAVVAAGFGTPAGSVTFLDGTTVLGTSPLTDGRAAFTTSSLAVGTHAITATYVGGGLYAASGSAAVSLTVDSPPPPAPPVPPVPPPVPPVPPPVPPVPPTPNPDLVGLTVFAVGPDAGGPPALQTFDASGALTSSRAVFDPAFTGGVRTAMADFNADGVPDVAVATGPGTAARVRVLDGATGADLLDFFPFGDFAGGAFVAAGDIDGDGTAELVVTPDVGGGPRVLVLSGRGFAPLADFFGIDAPNFRGGVRAAVGDLNGDGRADLIVAAGVGGGPRVAIYDGSTVGRGVPAKLVPDFFAFEPELRDGAYAALGDVNGDGLADPVLVAGAGGGPRVRIADAATILAIGRGPGLTDTAGVMADFFAGDPSSRTGARAAVKNLDGDIYADLVVGTGSGAGNAVTGYRGVGLRFGDATLSPFLLSAINALADGVFVG